jgi:LuxR family transcriptional regulator, quorum-sensing system regulator BjaR1
MEMRNIAVKNIITQLNQISDTRSFVVIFERLANLFGFEFFAISGIPGADTNLEQFLIVHNLPEGWVSEYSENNYFVNDPITLRCTETKDPFYWSDIITADKYLDVRHIILRAENHGLTHGICFPIHNISGFEAGISFSGSEAPLPKTDVQSLYLASIMAFNTLRKIRSDYSTRI